MTINTTKDGGHASPDPVIEHPALSQAPPAAAALDAASEPDLQSRIQVRRAQLIDKLSTLRGDVRPESVESRDKLKAKLSELAHIVKWGVVGGWASLGAPLTNKLEQWLTESARQLQPQHEQP